MRAQRIRVALVITRLNVGGPALQVLLLARHLDPGRFEVTVYAGTPGRREGDMAADLGAGVPIVRIAGLGREIRPLSDFRAFATLLAALRRQRPHVVHTHMAKAGLLGRTAARILGVPVVIHTFHGNVLQGYFSPWRSALFTVAERALARLSTRIIAISARQRAELERLGIGGPSRVVEIPLGIDLAPFLADGAGRSRAELVAGGTGPLVGIVARLVPIKGVDVFLDAAAVVARRRTDARFIVVGDGELRNDLEARARDLRIDDRVRFVGWRADLAPVYAALDVVVLTSRNEGTPTSLIEAMAAGCAIVATAVGGVPDLIEDGVTGTLTAPGDPAAVADAIHALFEDPDRARRLGLAAREKAVAMYDLATLRERIETLYSSLVLESR